MSDTLPIDLNSAALGIGRHVSGITDPFNGHIDEFRIAHIPALRRLDRDRLEQHERPRRVRRGRGRGGTWRRWRAAAARRRRCGRLLDGVRAKFWCRPGGLVVRPAKRSMSLMCRSPAHSAPPGTTPLSPVSSANLLGMLWPEMDAAFVTGGGTGGPRAAVWRPWWSLPGVSARVGVGGAL